MDKNLKLGLIVGVVLLGLMVVAIIVQYKNRSETEGSNLMPDDAGQVAMKGTGDESQNEDESNPLDTDEGPERVPTIPEQRSGFSVFEDDQTSGGTGGLGMTEDASSRSGDEDDTIVIEESPTKPDDDATITTEIGSPTQEESIKDIPSDFVPARDTSQTALGEDERETEGIDLAPPRALDQEPRGSIEEKPEEIETKTYKVKRGDSLYKIAAAVYGNGGKWPIIYKANKDILESPNSLRPNQKLKIPPLTQVSAKSSAPVAASPSPSSSDLGPREKQVMLKPTKTEGRKTHKVKKGDNLSKIAYIYYHDRNKWQPIFRANADRIVNKDRLLPGQELVIPSL